MANKLTELFHCMWGKAATTQEFKDAFISHLFHWQGYSLVCYNNRGISVLSIAGKIFAKLLINRLNVNLDHAQLPQVSKCGFMKDRGKTYMILTG